MAHAARCGGALLKRTELKTVSVSHGKSVRKSMISTDTPSFSFAAFAAFSSTYLRQSRAGAPLGLRRKTSVAHGWRGSAQCFGGVSQCNGRGRPGGWHCHEGSSAKLYSELAVLCGISEQRRKAVRRVGGRPGERA
jgi:hypothetical protein